VIERAVVVQASLRDEISGLVSLPGVETLRYCQWFVRDLIAGILNYVW